MTIDIVMATPASDDDDRRSTASAATTVFGGGDDATACELRRMRQRITSLRRQFVERYAVASLHNVDPTNVPDEFQDVDDLRSRYGEALVTFVERAREMLTPLTRGNTVRLSQVCQVVSRARVPWDESKYLDDDMSIPTRQWHIPSTQEIMTPLVGVGGGPPADDGLQAPPAPPGAASSSTLHPLDDEEEVPPAPDVTATDPSFPHLPSPRLARGRGRGARGRVAQMVRGVGASTSLPPMRPSPPASPTRRPLPGMGATAQWVQESPSADSSDWMNQDNDKAALTYARISGKEAAYELTVQNRRCEQLQERLRQRGEQLPPAPTQAEQTAQAAAEAVRRREAAAAEEARKLAEALAFNESVRRQAAEARGRADDMQRQLDEGGAGAHEGPPPPPPSVPLGVSLGTGADEPSFIHPPPRTSSRRAPGPPLSGTPGTPRAGSTPPSLGAHSGPPHAPSSARPPLPPPSGDPDDHDVSGTHDDGLHGGDPRGTGGRSPANR